MANIIIAKNMPPPQIHKRWIFLLNHCEGYGGLEPVATQAMDTTFNDKTLVRTFLR
ncbi:MAG: hypothetical protein QM405_04105 [Euryarchaeota archaeon]|nr:hypothetical protein [Euryarchaeota archaeon]HNS26228.1 hypothetical protein [Methanobacteriaceae archaeon]